MNFKPSQVVLHPIPLVGTMGKAEIEAAAGYVIYALVTLGDVWQPVLIAALVDIVEQAFNAQTEPIYSWGRSPYIKPEPVLMVERGFAVFGGDGELRTVAFTDKGRAALARWVRP